MGVQLGDRATLNPVLGNFQNFNEPNYQDYIETDIGGLFREHTSLVPHEKHLISSTKVRDTVGLHVIRSGGPHKGMQC